MFTFRKSLVRGVTVATLALLCAAPSRAQEKVDLRLNLQQGQVFEQVISFQQKISQTIQKQKLDTTAKTRFRLRMEVLESNADGSWKIKTIYKTLQADMHMTGFGGKEIVTHYDSTKPTKKLDPGTEIYKAMVGQSIISTVSPRSEVLKMEGWEKLVASMADSMKVPAAQRDQFVKTMQSAMESQTGQNMGLAPFPAQAVAIGDSWATKTNQTASVPIVLATRYTLKSRANGNAAIDVQSKIVNNPDATAMEVSDSKVKTNLSGTQTGVMHVNEATGLPQSFELHQRFQGQVSVTNAKTPKTPMVIPMYFKSAIYGRMVVAPR